MPTPQQNSVFVEQASCLFLRMVQDVSYIAFFYQFLINYIMTHPTILYKRLTSIHRNSKGGVCCTENKSRPLAQLTNQGVGGHAESGKFFCSYSITDSSEIISNGKPSIAACNSCLVIR